MSESLPITLLRRTAIGVLVGALGYGAWSLDQTTIDPFEAEGAERLAERSAEYVRLRLENDWPALYEMVDPIHRSKVDLRRFLNLYGLGLIDYHEITVQRTHIDPRSRKAIVYLQADGQLVPERMPDKYRAGFREEHPEHLRKTAEFEITWRWVKGEWFFRMDNEVISGVNASGKTIRPIGEGPIPGLTQDAVSGASATGRAARPTGEGPVPGLKQDAVTGASAAGSATRPIGERSVSGRASGKEQEQ